MLDYSYVPMAAIYPLHQRWQTNAELSARTLSRKKYTKQKGRIPLLLCC